MTYRLSQNVKPLIWVECLVERHSRSRIEYLVKARSQFKERSAASSVEIILPLPADAITPTVRTSQGKAEYVPEKSALVWTIKNFPGGREFLLRAKFGLPSVEAEDGGHGRMPPIKVKFEVRRLVSPLGACSPCGVGLADLWLGSTPGLLQIPYFTVSGIQVRYLKVIERSG